MGEGSRHYSARGFVSFDSYEATRIASDTSSPTLLVIKFEEFPRVIIIRISPLLSFSLSSSRKPTSYPVVRRSVMSQGNAPDETIAELI